MEGLGRARNTETLLRERVPAGKSSYATVHCCGFPGVLLVRSYFGCGVWMVAGWRWMGFVGGCVVESVRGRMNGGLRKCGSILLLQCSRN